MTLRMPIEHRRLMGNVVLILFCSFRRQKKRVLGSSCFCFCHNPTDPQHQSCLYLIRAEKQRMYSVTQRSFTAISWDCVTIFSRSAERARRRSRLELRLLDPLWVWTQASDVFWKKRPERWRGGAICVLLLMSAACWMAQFHFSGVLIHDRKHFHYSVHFMIKSLH